MRYIFFLFSIFFTLTIIGQTISFERLIQEENNQLIVNLFENEDGVYYGVGYTFKNNSDYRSALVMAFDQYGNTIDTKDYSLPEKAYSICNILQDTLGSLVLVGYLTDTTPDRFNSAIKMQRIDYSLNTINENTIFISSDYSVNIVYPSIGYNNEFLITAGIWRDSIPFSRLYALRMNNEFDYIYSSQEYIARHGYSIRQLSDSTYWIAAGVDSHYYLTDTLFNIKSWHPIPHGISDPIEFKWDSDTSFYVAGEYSEPGVHDIGALRQQHPFEDENYDFEALGLPDTTEMTALYGSLDFRNKDSIFIGGTSRFWALYYGTWPSYYYITQTDSLLNVRWERFYGGDAYYSMQKILATNDGGCLIAGTRFDYENATEQEVDIHILKLNENGLLVGEGEEHTIETMEAIVFPNPGTNYLKVRVAAQYENSLFQLFDIKGNLIVSENINGKWGEINTTFLNTGTYVYTISNNKGLFETGKWLKGRD